MAFAGSMVLTSLALAALHDPHWLLLTAFAGLNQMQAAITGFCPAVIVFRKLGARLVTLSPDRPAERRPIKENHMTRDWPSMAIEAAVKQGVERGGSDFCLCDYAHSQFMNDSVALLTALAKPTRMAAIRLLRDGQEHCVCELMPRLGASQSRMSRHMATLKAAGLVVDRREDAQWVRYRRAPNLPVAVAGLIEAALSLPTNAERIAA